MSDTESKPKNLAIQKNQIKHRILDYLAVGPEYKETELYEAMKALRVSRTPDSFRESQLEVLENIGYIQRRARGVWAITVDGLAKLRVLNEPELAKTPSRIYHHSKEVLSLADLNKSPARPGAMGAYYLPSLQGNKRIYPNRG